MDGKVMPFPFFSCLLALAGWTPGFDGMGLEEVSLDRNGMDVPEREKAGEQQQQQQQRVVRERSGLDQGQAKQAVSRSLLVERSGSEHRGRRLFIDH